MRMATIVEAKLDQTLLVTFTRIPTEDHAKPAVQLTAEAWTRDASNRPVRHVRVDVLDKLSPAERAALNAVITAIDRVVAEVVGIALT